MECKHKMIPLKSKRPIRSFHGIRWRTIHANKCRLEKDFFNRCAYCDDADKYYGIGAYHVDHFAPKSLFPELKFNYDNLTYSCPYCNRAKSNKWAGATPHENVVGDMGFIDVCQDEYDQHLERDERTGFIYPRTKLGQYMFEELNLFLLRHVLLFRMDQITSRIKILEALKTSTTCSELKSQIEEIYNELIKFHYYYIETFFSENSRS